VCPLPQHPPASFPHLERLITPQAPPSSSAAAADADADAHKQQQQQQQEPSSSSTAGSEDTSSASDSSSSSSSGGFGGFKQQFDSFKSRLGGSSGADGEQQQQQEPLQQRASRLLQTIRKEVAEAVLPRDEGFSLTRQYDGPTYKVGCNPKWGRGVGGVSAGGGGGVSRFRLTMRDARGGVAWFCLVLPSCLFDFVTALNWVQQGVGGGASDGVCVMDHGYQVGWAHPGDGEVGQGGRGEEGVV